LGLWNLSDRSTLVSPSFSHSASDEATLAGGAFFGLGDDEIDLSGGLPSEYGVAGTTVYLSVSIFSLSASSIRRARSEAFNL